MTKNENILFKLLSDKGFVVKYISYWPTFGYRNGGWFATVIEKDGYDDEFEQEYHLGKDFIEAKGQIEHDEIRRL